MKPYIFILFLISFCSVTSAQNSTPADSELYDIRLVQGQDTFAIKSDLKNEISLKRAPFQFIFTLKKSNYIFFIASESDEYFKTKPERTFPVCLMFCGGAVGAGVTFNPDKDMCIYGFADGIECWYYDTATDHRFDNPGIATAQGRQVSRSIEQVYDYPTKKQIPLKKLKSGTAIYMVFSDIDNEPCDECESHMEVTPWRRYLKLNFE